MTENQGLQHYSSKTSSQSNENSFQMSNDGQAHYKKRREINFPWPKSPFLEINKTAQQHFNNKAIQREHSNSNNYLTNQGSNSLSNNSYKQRSLNNHGIQRSFSELDEFLRQTYEKHQIYNLVRLFVEMQDQLVTTFQCLKRLQQIKNGRDYHEGKGDPKAVRAFSEINQFDELPYEAEQNIIQDFLCNLKEFFSPQLSNGKKLTQEEQSLGADYSFSAHKYLFLNHNGTRTQNKKGHIHTSRSKNVIQRRQREKANVLSDEKMIESINFANDFTPLKFDEPALHSRNFNNKNYDRNQEKSIRMTSSQMIDEDSMMSECQQNALKEEKFRRIFQLRQQKLKLENENSLMQDGISAQVSYNEDSSLVGEFNYKNININQSMQKNESMLLDSSREHLEAPVLGNNDSFNESSNQKAIPMIIRSHTKPLIGKPDFIRQDISQSNENISFTLDQLQTIQQEYHEKQNNPNSLNVMEKICPISKSSHKVTVQKIIPQKSLDSKFSKFVQPQSQFIPLSYQKENSDKTKNKQRATQSETLSNFRDETNLFVERFFYDFKQFFRTEMEIQLILMKMIRTKRILRNEICDQYLKLIEWYSRVTIKCGSKVESVDRFVKECLKTKQNLLLDFRRMI